MMQNTRIEELDTESNDLEKALIAAREHRQKELKKRLQKKEKAGDKVMAMFDELKGIKNERKQQKLSIQNYQLMIDDQETDHERMILNFKNILIQLKDKEKELEVKKLALETKLRDEFLKEQE